MKKPFIIIILLLIFTEGIAQAGANAVKWRITASEVAAVGDTIQIEISGKITDDWYIYASNSDSTEYVTPAFIDLESDGSFELVSSLVSVNSSIYYDHSLGREVKVFRDTAIMMQRIVIKRKRTALKGTLNYMLVRIDEKGGMVRHDSKHFSLEID